MIEVDYYKLLFVARLIRDLSFVLTLGSAVIILVQTRANRVKTRKAREDYKNLHNGEIYKISEYFSIGREGDLNIGNTSRFIFVLGALYLVNSLIVSMITGRLNHLFLFTMTLFLGGYLGFLISSFLQKELDRLTNLQIGNLESWIDLLREDREIYIKRVGKILEHLKGNGENNAN